MKWITCIFMMSFILFPSLEAHASKEKEAVIVEVEGDVLEHKEFIERNYPFIDVVHTYSTIFNGLALEGKADELAKLAAIDFILAVHHVRHYFSEPEFTLKSSGRQGLEEVPNETEYTGKGVKVAVIDTGIDYRHPDLKENYAGGYDVFDLDDDPLETQIEEGTPTNHGTHVAGIIAANGKLKGVAPEAEIYAYRALGPGGYGSSVHVLAALEQAVLDRADVINLSLGNSVNGPDYPTSAAVNKVVELGIPVVIANGNSGPGSWTVGAPATAEAALSVGAEQEPSALPFLQYPKNRKTIAIAEMSGSLPWNFMKDYAVIRADDKQADLTGKIALFQRGGSPFGELAIEAQERGAAGVLISNHEPGQFAGMIENPDGKIQIPVASISKEDGEWMRSKAGEYFKTIYEKNPQTVADFSSRGPVTVNWRIKPEILAPGTNIASTVPGGYEVFSGTSMAAPFVAGAIALMKEAHPDWPAEKIYSALKTTALPLVSDETRFIPPSSQGHGVIRLTDAIRPAAIIYDAALHIGKMTEDPFTKKLSVKIENLSSEVQRYRFNIPKRQTGLQWKLPLSFTVQPGETEEINFELYAASEKLAQRVHEGYLELYEQSEGRTYYLPYLLVNQEAKQPKTFGFEFSLKPFSEEEYMYRIYATEELDKFTVDLFDSDTLVYKRSLFEMEDVQIGINEGEISRKEFEPGSYIAAVTAVTKEGVVESYEVLLLLQ